MKSSEPLAIFAITAVVITSFIYFIILEKIKRARNNKTRAQLTVAYVLRKMSGFVLFGLIPAVTAGVFFNIKLADAGLILSDTFRLWPWIAGASMFFILLNIFNSKNIELRMMYPELRLKEWDLTGLVISAGGWIIYLTAYEYLFRGLLLFSCLEAFGLWPAIVINLALYASLHLPKGMKEATAAIPFGALICYLTIESHSIVPAVFIHSLQAISIELFCIYRNPEMKFNFFKK